jgi:hypothetical protein
MTLNITARPPARPAYKELIYDSFVVISDFIATQLQDEPIHLLGKATWNVLLEQAQVYKALLDECTAQLEKISWPGDQHQEISAHLRCNRCSSELLKPDNPEATDPLSLRFVCRACGTSSEYSELVEQAVGESFFAEHYLAMTDGDDPPVDDCNECGRATYVRALGYCVACGRALRHTQCARCHNALGAQEQEFHGLCGYCYQLAHKDD